MTETVKTEVQRTPDEAYGVTEMRFLCASQIVIRSTGEVVKITPAMKLVYIYMKNQFIGFSGREQQFYTDQRQMAAALDISRDTLSKILAALKKLGIVENAGWKGNSESYTVHFFSDVADGLQVIHKEYKGAPAWDHERANKNFKSKSKMKEAARPSPEEREDGVQQQEHEQQSPDVASSSATDDPEQQSGVSQFAGDSCDDVSANDAPSLSKPAGGNVVGIPWIANSFTPRGPLVPEARRWAQSQGATTWQDEIKLVWKLTGKTNMREPEEHMRPDDIPAPEPAKQQANGYAPQLDYDEDQPF
ncbi:hypothetical protein AB9D06_05700 [Enterobacter cloacae]|uniref:DUF6945 domain-containing protein n=1 Tax=Enterobacter cloacae complex TaxID=354276 RepID=UPI0012391268|nr:hypothetical protein [Enterobacter roggenkampii]MCK6768801.1 hypothetical protein [Enterobacter roggenkampii]